MQIMKVPFLRLGWRRGSFSIGIGRRLLYFIKSPIVFYVEFTPLTKYYKQIGTYWAIYFWYNFKQPKIHISWGNYKR